MDTGSICRRSLVGTSEVERYADAGHGGNRPQYRRSRLPDCNAARLSCGRVGRYHDAARVSSDALTFDVYCYLINPSRLPLNNLRRWIPIDFMSCIDFIDFYTAR